MISLHRDLTHLYNGACYAEDFEPVLIDDVESITTAIQRWPWSSIQWRFGIRLKIQFERAAWCVLDFDDGEMTLAQAKQSFVDCIHFIGTTRNHQKAKKDKPAVDRFRVAVKFDEPIRNLDDYEATMDFYIRKYGTDRKCKDGARFFWPCVTIEQFSGEGYTFETFVAPPPKPPPDYSAYRATKSVPRWVEGYLKFGFPQGARSDLCNRFGFYLSQCGFDEAEIAAMVFRSPTDWDGIDRVEAERQIRNGVRAGLRKLPDGEETSPTSTKDAEVADRG